MILKKQDPKGIEYFRKSLIMIKLFLLILLQIYLIEISLKIIGGKIMKDDHVQLTDLNIKYIIRSNSTSLNDKNSFILKWIREITLRKKKIENWK